jgi:hypothetical protein
MFFLYVSHFSLPAAFLLSLPTTTLADIMAFLFVGYKAAIPSLQLFCFLSSSSLWRWLLVQSLCVRWMRHGLGDERGDVDILMMCDWPPFGAG